MNQLEWLANEGCRHERTHVITATFGPHKAKQICIDCLKFLGWGTGGSAAYAEPEQEKKEPLVRYGKPKDHLGACEYYLKSGALTPWEVKFINDGMQYSHWTSKQEAIFNKIGDAVRKAAGPIPSAKPEIKAPIVKKQSYDFNDPNVEVPF